MRISIVIPAWCEAESIEASVRRALAVADEVIVVDAQSSDGTAQLAERAGARVLQAGTKGRGAQLQTGALAASGDVLLFLHADALLSEGARPAIFEALADQAVVGGNFALRFVPERGYARLFTWLNHVRRRWLHIYYGDSAVFVRTPVYHELGGFRPSPILEDYEFVRRLERHGRTAYLRTEEVHVSARRFAKRPWRTLFVWVSIQLLYSLGVSPERLAALYVDAR